jgi:hypothetical protein
MSVIEQIVDQISDCHKLDKEPKQILLSKPAYDALKQEVDTMVVGLAGKPVEEEIVRFLGIPIVTLDVNFMVILVG